MVNQKRLLDEFFRLVSIDAEFYEEREMADYLKERLKELGLLVKEDRAGELLAEKSKACGRNAQKQAGNLYGFLKGNKPGDAVLFSSHMDTVSPGNGKRPVLHEDGTITSDGTTVLGSDDAAGIAAILEALEQIRENDLPHPDIEVLFPVAEEPYAQGSRIFDYAGIKAEQAYVLDLSGPVGTAAIAAPSILSFQITLEGRSAHAGFCPETGIHAISIAGKAISSVQNGRVDPDTTVNIGTIQGGIQRNIVPDSCILTGEIRSMVHEKALDQMEKIRKIFEEEAEQAGGRAIFDVTEEFQAYHIGDDEKVVQRFLQVCGRLGIEAKLETTFGGSDNNHFAAHGIRGIVPACGMNKVHTTKEYTTVEQLTKSAEITLGLMTL